MANLAGDYKGIKVYESKTYTAKVGGKTLTSTSLTGIKSEINKELKSAPIVKTSTKSALKTKKATSSANKSELARAKANLEHAKREYALAKKKWATNPDFDPEEVGYWHDMVNYYTEQLNELKNGNHGIRD